MKTFVRSAAFVAGLLCVGATSAQSKTTTTTEPAKMTTSRATTSTGQPIAATPQWTPLNVERMMKELSLKEEQTSKLKQLDAQYNKEHAAGGTNVADLLRKRDADVKGVLTADQYTKWAKQSASMAAPAKPATTATPAQPTTKPAPKPASK